jgi:nicotinamide-nucleotide amidase
LDKELRAALSRSSVIIATGGLGSTLDDHTRHIATVLFGSKLEYNETVAADLKRRYGDRVINLHDQASVPTHAMPLLNSVGIAPGLVFTAPNKMLILLPGIPLEMQVMLNEKVLPLLKERFPVKSSKKSAEMHFCLLTESVVDPFLRTCKEKFPEVHVGIYPSYGQVHVALHSENAQQLHAFKEECTKQFATHLFSAQNQNLEEVLQHWFIQNHKTLALAESMTGGTIASQLVSVPGASAYFLGSFVVYSDALKMHALGVSPETLKKHGDVSKECVLEMLEGVFRNSKADYAIAVTGVAGPTGSQPVGTVWSALGHRNGPPQVGHYSIPGPRAKVIQAASRYLLGALWRHVVHSIIKF